LARALRCVRPEARLAGAAARVLESARDANHREWSAWLRLGAVSLAVFAWLGVAQLAPALHFALVVHRVCAEHGELLHEAAAPARAAAPAKAGVSAGNDVGHEHEHCGVLATTGSLAQLAAPSAKPAPGASARAAALRGARTAHVRIALLSFAPKLAPPATACG
jgi:hypothetical protein